MNATQAFRKQFGDCANFMTPLALQRGSTRLDHWELSRGYGFSGDRIYGVTVLDIIGERTEGLSQSFSGERQAWEHIKTLS
jgi:hypothetical protein